MFKDEIRIPAINKIPLEDGLLAGDIILLWRINFGTFTTQTWIPKYFRYTYGIDAREHLNMLLERGFAVEESAFDSLDHINAAAKKEILKIKGVKGLFRLKSKELDGALKENFSEEELGNCFSVRGYKLSPKGIAALAANRAVVDRHPKKDL